ncbi:RNA polymerase sigma factor [Lichenicoccus sp.]|uniref:RNA polymerase sigma factor n=1 Tax=Lichenicoccus sp. TaxID=2781899 RepID=UPI003D0F4C11
MRRVVRATAGAGVAEDPDASLVARMASGDEAAFRTLVDRKLPRLHALAQRLLGAAGEADDVAQEALLRAWRQARHWQPGAARFETWLHRVVLNLCTDIQRKRREVVMAEPPERVDPAPRADQALQSEETARRVRQALARLPPRQREAIALQTYQELSNIEIAQVLEISVEALESLLSRGRRMLRDLLGE